MLYSEAQGSKRSAISRSIWTPFLGRPWASLLAVCSGRTALLQLDEEQSGLNTEISVLEVSVVPKKPGGDG